ncbi:hypothetical protein JKP88DRAFT_229461 [Tribonema minus]|uniref:Uncharacterized protein n=1 Tax=Tribonema minus TaxID=303371 RepID=A0A835YH11_9STRA|nr:hypothetical protein JKP88DRAFT_229461 [Tribonema minus]
MQRAEDALEAALTRRIFQPNMAVTLLREYGKAGNLSRMLYWVQRLSASGRKLTPGIWNAAIDAAHKAGDADTADALWRDAAAAGGMGLYKEMRRINRGAGWRMASDQPARSRDAASTVLDLSSCSGAVALAALRAEARELRLGPPSAFRYVFMGTRPPSRDAIVAELNEGMRTLGLHMSAVRGAAYFYRIVVPASQPSG